MSAAAALLEQDTALRDRIGIGFRDREGWGIREGAQWRIVVSPGVVEVRSTSPARAERAANRAAERPILRRSLADGPVCLVGSCLHESCGEYRVQRLDYGNDSPKLRGRVTVWSAKSRAKMCQTLGQLDYAPLFVPGETPAMVTLTYPGDWLPVAGGPSVCRGHVETFKKRFRRAWGRPLVAVWKREFQERGAPHYHLHMTIPDVMHARTKLAKLGFHQWLSVTWAEVVESASCKQPAPTFEKGRIVCCERHRHIAAGTGIDYAEGLKASDPRRLAVYFSKHGGFAAKEYQNAAPEEWDTEAEGVGRFWGYWGLKPAKVAVDVTPDEADAARRTLRRYARANGYLIRVPVWRKVTTVDRETGELGWKWRRRTTSKRVRRLGGPAGFLAVNDGPVVVGQVARYLDQVRGRGTSAGSGRGPVGFLP